MSQLTNSEWTRLTLGSIGEMSNGVNFKSEQMGSGLKLINVKDIFRSGIFLDFDSLDLVNLEGQKNIAKYYVEEGDIYFVRSSVKREGIGLVSLARDTDYESIHCGFVIRLRLTTDQVKPLFLAYLLRSPLYRKRIMNISSGAAITNLSQRSLSSFAIEVPSIPIQERISDILLAYDDLIDNNNRRIALLEEAIHRLYREWFVHLRFPGHEHTPVVAGVPEGWEKRPVKDTFEITGGGTPRRKEERYWLDGTINWFTPSDLTKSRSMFSESSSEKISEAGFSNSSARMFPPYSIMMTSRATIGVISINTAEATTNQGFITCIPNERVPLYFLYCWLTANVTVFENYATGATFKEISKGVFKKIPVLLPSQSLLKDFHEIVEYTVK